MEIASYLNFNGQCAEAFRVYAECLGGRIVRMQTHGESAMKDRVPVEWHDKVIHARLLVGNQVLMGSDAPPPHFAPAQGMHVSLTVDSAAEAQRIFATLSAGGKVGMPFGKTFWAEAAGMCVDRFGIPWIVTTPPL